VKDAFPPQGEGARQGGWGDQNPHILQVKWPNDLYWQKQKLCGCLLELVQKPSQAVIIGIGLNVNSLPEQHNVLTRPWTSLKAITGQDIDRNPLIARLISKIQDHWQTLATQGFTHFQKTWQSLDLLMNQYVRVKHPAGLKQGKVIGISPMGELILLTESQSLDYLSAGEVSIGVLD
jgi:BirA family biotin operon repressor/biotin-[acetyl-CoA-carboxylase] ligase